MGRSGYGVASRRVAEIRFVVFDVGETLVDETRAWSLRAQAAGVTPLTLFAALGALIERGEDHRRVWSLLGVAPPDLEVAIEPSDVYPDVPPCLRALSEAGYRLGLAGNQPSSARDSLERLGLPVELVATSGELGVEKPDPAFFERICERADAAPSQIAYVGDRLDNDIEPARAAGMFTVFIRRGPWGHIHAHLPGAARVDARIDSLAELPGVLDGWRSPG
jgi:HAD superfamily hydrolase (TIGR01662 family)